MSAGVGWFGLGRGYEWGEMFDHMCVSPQELYTLAFPRRSWHRDKRSKSEKKKQLSRPPRRYVYNQVK